MSSSSEVSGSIGDVTSGSPLQATTSGPQHQYLHTQPGARSRRRHGYPSFRSRRPCTEGLMMSLTTDDPAAGGRAGRFPGGSAVAPHRSDQQPCGQPAEGPGIAWRSTRRRPRPNTAAPVAFAGGPADDRPRDQASGRRTPIGPRVATRISAPSPSPRVDARISAPATGPRPPNRSVDPPDLEPALRARLFVTDLLCLLWAALGVHLIELPPSRPRYRPSRRTCRSSPRPRCSSSSGCWR